MNASIKTLAAAVALAVGGVASAAPLSGEDLFFSAWNGNANSPSSIVINLTETSSEFRADANSTRTLTGAAATTLTNWLTSLGPDAATVQWNVAGAMLGPSPGPDYGALTTSQNAETANSNDWGLFTLDAIRDNFAIFFNTVNPNLGSTDVYTAPNVNALFSAAYNGGAGGVDTLAGIGEAMEFYALIADQAGGGAEFFDGDLVQVNPESYRWNLNFDGTAASLTYAPVPLPAAVWLLGSGLLGLFGIGRRKAA